MSLVGRRELYTPPLMAAHQPLSPAAAAGGRGCGGGWLEPAATVIAATGRMLIFQNY